MVPDERDRRFDKALSRHLRSAAPSGEAAKSSADAAFESASCPDPETLAAYHERSLLAQEMNSCKEHIVGCAHCQSILAQLEATDEIPLQAAEEKEILARKESESVLAGQSLEVLPAATAPSQSQREAASVPSKKTREVRFHAGPRWKWLAPAGALAAGLLVWIALHENQPLPLPSATEVKVATKQESRSASPPVSTGVTQGSPAAPAQPALTKQQSEIVSSNARAELGAADLRQGQDYQVRVSPSKHLADKESGLRKDVGRQVSADSLSAAIQADRDAKSVTGLAQEKVELQTQEQAANAQSQNQYLYNAPKVSGPGPLGQAESKKKLMKPAQPAPAPPAEAVSGFAGATALEMVAVSNPHLIAAPGSNVIWRAGRAGLIEFSSDGGASWSRQTSGVLVDLTTGSAPSDKVCWIVGRVGAVLLTTDGGAHWKTLSSPLSEDFGGIHATDALHATIWNARNTKTYETSDGGLTWKPVPNP